MDRQRWNATVSGLPNPHFLQTYEWGQVKAKYGWTPLYAIWKEDGSVSVLNETDHWPLETGNLRAAALVLRRQIIRSGFAARLSILYLPKGPLLDWSDQFPRTRVLNDLQSYAKREGAIFLKMDPDVVLGTGVPGGEEAVADNRGQAIQAELERRGWAYSPDQVQFRNTVLLDLSPSEDDLLMRMKQKTRYNIRLAGKKGVAVRVGTRDDLDRLYDMYAETSVRDSFVIRDRTYYRFVWELFMNSDESACEPLIAEVDGEPVAAIFVFYFAGRAYYVYGMSRAAHREKMPAYLLQWEAIRRAKARGCHTYDLWGAPEVFDESDSMWGVFRFKEGLGGEVVRTLGAWDFVPSRFWYRMYSEIIPRLLGLMRSRGKAKTKQQLGA